MIIVLLVGEVLLFVFGDAIPIDTRNWSTTIGFVLLVVVAVALMARSANK